MLVNVLSGSYRLQSKSTSTTGGEQSVIAKFRVREVGAIG